MFASFVFEKSSAEYADKILLIDTDNLESKTNYCAYFAAQGFQIIRYENDIHFRVEHDDAINDSSKCAVIATADVYIPFDIRQIFRCFNVSLSELFPKLNTAAIREAKQMNYDLLAMAYRKNFSDLHIKQLTEQFIQKKIYCQTNIEEYLQEQVLAMNSAASAAQTYRDWMNVANIKATIDVMATKYEYPHQNRPYTQQVHSMGAGGIRKVVHQER